MIRAASVVILKFLLLKSATFNPSNKRRNSDKKPYHQPSFNDNLKLTKNAWSLIEYENLQWELKQNSKTILMFNSSASFLPNQC
jgi:hypothetical protein